MNNIIEKKYKNIKKLNFNKSIVNNYILHILYLI